METAAVVGLLLVCGLLVGRHMLQSLGIGEPSGKPDCGCGHCGDKRKGRGL